MNQQTGFLLLGVLLLLLACTSELEQYGRHYQQHRDLASLQKATALIEVGADTAFVRSILGEPIDFGFDYRYLSDSVGEHGAPVGAVFGIDDQGKVSWKDVFEIRE